MIQLAVIEAHHIRICCANLLTTASLRRSRSRRRMPEHAVVQFAVIEAVNI